MTGSAPCTVVVLLTWSATRHEVDPLSGVVTHDPRSVALSAVDEAALEVALRLGEQWEVEVIACSAGPPEVEGALEVALATGAARAVRVDVGDGAQPPAIGEALAGWIRPLGSVVVVAGSHGVDFGSGAVPAVVAHELGAAQALGLVEVQAGSAGVVEAIRRADRGVRERVRATAPSVISVEGSVATLRRASLRATLAAPRRPIEVVAPAHDRRPSRRLREVGAHPYRPRPHVVAPPAGADALDRIRQLTGAMVPRTPPRTLELEPEAAADAILDQLGTWGRGPRADGLDD
jgi:electron transfer flavoprotein beta subunit